MSKEAKDHFNNQWGTGFLDATLQSEKGLLKLSMEDIFETMESYHREQSKVELEDLLNEFTQENKKVQEMERTFSNEFRKGYSSCVGDLVSVLKSKLNILLSKNKN